MECKIKTGDGTWHAIDTPFDDISKVLEWIENGGMRDKKYPQAFALFQWQSIPFSVAISDIKMVKIEDYGKPKTTRRSR